MSVSPQELKSIIVSDSGKLLDIFKDSLGNYAHLLQDQHYINEYLFPIGQLVQRRFQLISPRNKFEDDETKSLCAFAMAIIKFELLQKLLIIVLADKFSKPAFSNSDALTNKLIRFFLDAYCTDDNDMKLWSIKPDVTDQDLLYLFEGIIKSPLDYVFKYMIQHDHQELLIHFAHFDLDISSYQLWSYTKKLGNMVGFKLPAPSKLMVRLFVQGRDVGGMELITDGNTDSINGLNWTIEILKNFLHNNVSEDNITLLKDVNTLLRSYQYTSFANSNNELLSHYMNGEAISIPGGWAAPSGHGVGIALYRNSLIYCNRGRRAGFEGTSGIYIYDMTKILVPTIDTFNSLRKIHNSVGEFTEALNQIVDLRRPAAILPLKDQNRGNCVFANSKSLMKGLLFCFEYKRNRKDPAGALTFAHLLYKRITADMRTTVMLDLATTINYVADFHKSQFYVILSLLILEHHSKPQQQDRIYKALNILSPLEVNGVLNMISKVTFQKAVDAAFMNDLLQKYAEPSETKNEPKRPITAIAKFFAPKPLNIRPPASAISSSLSARTF